MPSSRKEALFITLTDSNQVSVSAHRQQIVSFLFKLCHKLKTHLYVKGTISETGNAHSHLIVMIDADQIHKVESRLSKFKPSKHWSRKHLDFQAFDQSRKEACYQYVLINHEGEPFDKGFCPKVTRRCRNGHCHC